MTGCWNIYFFCYKPQDSLKWTTQKMIEIMKNNGESQHVKHLWKKKKVFYDHKKGIWHAVLHLKLFKQHYY